MRDLLGVAANPALACAAAMVALLVCRSLLPANGSEGWSLATDLAARDVLRLITGAG